jgi:hypothetical protein
MGKRQVSTANSLYIEPVSLHAASTRNLTRAPSFALAYIDREADHVQKDRPVHLREPRHARRRLALARGYWLHLSDHHGDDRLSEQAPRSRRTPVSWPDKANPRPCTRGSEAIPFGTTAWAVSVRATFLAPHLFGKQSGHS